MSHSLAKSLLKSLVCVEAAALAIALGVTALFAGANALGVAGARAQHIAPPPFEAGRLAVMAATIALGGVLTSLPTAIVLGLVAARARRGRLLWLALAGVACSVVQVLVSAYPIAALSPYFLSNTPPSAPFPFGATWDIPLGVVLAVGIAGAVLASPFIAVSLGVAVYKLERWTRPEAAG